ncbi:hypothetical protein Nepgr_027071 [Nepenthes gracilis]|uniref:Uncharacterized protein n=1 Tax=Nepenthes gracilis TaxID=150966 RepID=A0AAD3Y155_NEPGR|nr:hypothetical protein Nepgr_027071 [Nepenthes gracilis]
MKKRQKKMISSDSDAAMRGVMLPKALNILSNLSKEDGDANFYSQNKVSSAVDRRPKKGLGIHKAASKVGDDQYMVAMMTH